MPSKGAQLMALINAPEIEITPGIFDGYSARLIEKAGFKSATISGAGDEINDLTGMGFLDELERRYTGG